MGRRGAGRSGIGRESVATWVDSHGWGLKYLDDAGSRGSGDVTVDLSQRSRP